MGIWVDAFLRYEMNNDDSPGPESLKTDSGSLQIPKSEPHDSLQVLPQKSSGTVPSDSIGVKQQVNLPKPEVALPTDSIKLVHPVVDSSGLAAKSFSDTSKTGIDSLDAKKMQGALSDSVSRHKGGIMDSLKHPADSTKIKDTVKIDSMKIDSTARLKHFKYKRHDSPTISFYAGKQSKLFAQPSQKKRTVEIDSTGKLVVIKEKVGEQVVKYPLNMTVDDYLALKMRTKEQELWDDLAYKYELKEGKKDLTNLLKDITDFEIPLPSVGVLSIFGAPKISLRINGSVDIHGAWRNETTEGVTASRLGNTRNEPDFRQQVQVNVNGTIGDKLHIDADWNTERTFEYENQLKIRYTGYEDEMVQSVEAGNVSLQTSSLVGGSEALFGIKAGFKLGPLTLTALASQKKGEVKEKSLTGGTASQPFSIHAYEYSQNNYFLDEVYADTSDAPDRNIFFKYYGKATSEVVSQYYVKDIEVWKSFSQIVANREERSVVAYIDLPPTDGVTSYPDTLRKPSWDDPTGGAEMVKGRFIRLAPEQDYIIHRETGYITLKTSLAPNDVIAVAYQIPGEVQGSSRFYGEFIKEDKDTTKKLVLKLIKPATLQPSFKKAWKLQLRNIYPTGVRNLKKEGFKLDIQRLVAGSEPQSMLGSVRLIQAFGLDLTDESKTGKADGVFDFNVGITVIPETGEIIFPKLQPFGRNLPGDLPDAENIRYNDVYDTLVSAAKLNTERDKFVITGTSTGEMNNKFSLGFNIVENSVKVILDGRELSNNVDYTVDYAMGSLEIRNAAALVPGANLKITYEENDLFQMASKSLFGFRGMIDISRNTKLGFSMLTLSQQTLSDKVRIGEEPLSNSIYGIDFSTQADLPFFTKWIDKVISTKELSSIAFRGEAALMNPDPNTKKSTISSDQDNSIAYIDDFEGSKKIIPVGVSYTMWKDASPPVSMPGPYSRWAPDSLIDFKAKSWWYNFLPSDVRVTHIWPLKRVAKGDEAVTVLDFVFEPADTNMRGTYNYRPRLGINSANNWGGMMKLLSTTASNLEEDKIEYIEFWAKIIEAPSNAKVYIDLGKISEDVIPNTELDTEDKNKNELIDEGEDTGLDGKLNASETAEHPGLGGDPSGDDFNYYSSSNNDPKIFKSINGTEGNAKLTDNGRIPDTEDLNRNGNLDVNSSFFRYEIPLDTNEATNRYIAGGGGNKEGWYLYRIPLKSPTSSVGTPLLSVVETIRLFVTGASSPVHFRIAEFNLVGNQWDKTTQKDLSPTDSVLKLSVVNVEDNPDYQSPYGVQRERDRSRPDQEVYRNEQSLSLKFTNLPEGEERSAYKNLSRTLDVFNYREMKLFIHSENNIDRNSLSYYQDTLVHNSDVFIRFGSDTNNYYEYIQPVRANPSENNWSEISIVFSELTALKQARDSANMKYKVAVPGKEGHFYSVRGNPALTQIQKFWIGVVNRKDNDPRFQDPISGEIWVNELRVIGADNTKGWAYTGSVSLKLADLITLNYNYSRTDPYFHRLADRFGSRTESINWGLSADMDLIKFLPFDPAESNLKLSYSRTESIGKPLYLPGTDIKVDEAVELQKRKLLTLNYSDADATSKADSIRKVSQTINTSDTWAVPGIRLKIPSNYWLIRDTWNSLTFSFNYNKTYSRNPSISQARTWIWNASMAYNLNISPDYSFAPADIWGFSTLLSFMPEYKQWRIYFLPQSFTYNISAKRSRNYTDFRPTLTSDSRSEVTRDFGAARGGALNWKFTENGLLNLSAAYNYDFTSSLTYLETDAYNQQRRESRIWRDIFTGAFFGRDFQFSQNFDLKTAPKLPNFWDISKNFTLTAGYGARYQWSNDYRQEELGRSIGTQSRYSAGLTVRVKSILEPIFGTDAPSSEPESGERGRNFEEQGKAVPAAAKPGDSTVVIDSTKSGTNKLKAGLRNVTLILKTLGRMLFIDYDNVRVNFSNDVTFSANGIKSKGTGFRNFWGLTYSEGQGPSRAFMLGLNNETGPRAAKATLSDNYSKRNAIDLSTSKPLWEGARMEINWKVNWSENSSTTWTSDTFGNLTRTNFTQTGSLGRSFFSLPPFFVLSAFKSGIKRVNELYSGSGKSLSEAFVQGFESMPWFNSVGFLKQISKYVPRANWRLSWDGLEKYYIFKTWTKRVSLDHAYTSDYNEGWRITPDGKKEVSSQKISYGFQPLVGLNITFNDLWSGNFTGNIKYSTRSGFDLGAATKNITEDFGKDIGITLSYNKSGFEFPLFGISLKNDFEFSFSYTNTRNSSVMYDMEKFDEKGTPQNGTIRTSMEPRVRYVMSSRVTVSVFYKRSTTEPEGAARIPPTTTNEMGLDIRISIQ